MEIFGFYFVWLGILAALAFIPAYLAKEKGYSFGGFYAFGFFCFMPALIVSLVIEDKTYKRPPNYGRPVSNNTGYYGQVDRYYMPAYNAVAVPKELAVISARNCYVQAPYRALYAKVYQNQARQLYYEVTVKTYGQINCDSMLVRALFYDVFGNLIESANNTIRSIKYGADGLFFQFGARATDMQSIAGIKVFELYIDATAKGTAVTYYQNTPIYAAPLALTTLAEVKTKYGMDAIAQYHIEQSGMWQCVCGMINEPSAFCPMCGRKQAALAAIAEGKLPSIDVYINELKNANYTVQGAKEKLMSYENKMPNEYYQGAMRFLEEQELLAKRYGISFGEKEILQLEKILTGQAK